MNNRRRLIIALGSAASIPVSVLAQSTKPPVVIGWLGSASRGVQLPWVSSFREGLAELGWKDGTPIIIEERYTDGHDDRLNTLARELVAKRPALILAQGLRAARAAVKVAPNTALVMVSNLDPVAAGLVSSFARPGGMVTGIAGFGTELSGKRVELLIEAAPGVKRVGFLVPSVSPLHSTWLELAHRSTARYGVQAYIAEVANPKDIEPAISRLAKQGVQALVILPYSLLTNERLRIVKRALAQGWPVVGVSEWAAAGALLSYSADTAANYRRAAFYADRILRGARPGDLPIERPMTFELVVNLKTAKALGLTMPPEIMVQATRVIQ